MEKIPTAEEFLDSKGYAEAKYIMVGGEDVLRLLEEYSNIKAKFYVKAALEAASKKGKVYDYKRDKSLKQHVSNDETFIVDEDSILNAYPENLIK